MILISKYIVPKGFIGITLFPFVFLRHKNLKVDKVLVNHENIHLKQQIELLIVPFFIVYGFEFLVRLIQHKNWHKAYRNISFEREAHQNETNLDFLKTRRLWNFLNYF